MDIDNISYWFPRLSASGVPVPRTNILKTEINLDLLCTGDRPTNWVGLLSGLRWAAADIGFPIFLRTGHTSYKHEWRETCYVEGPDDIGGHLVSMVENSIAGQWSPVDTWAVREILPLYSTFLAFRGMPIGRERRYFINGSVGGDHAEVLCHHPHWPAYTIAKASDPDWPDLLAELNRESDEEVRHLTSLSLLVAEQFGGVWSLDWAMTADGTWFAIDMAPADRSYHWPECPIASR